MPVVTINPTAGLERAEFGQRIDKALSQFRTNIGRSFVLHEFEEWNIKKSPKRWAARLGQ